jgi:hypothetical protein
VAATTKSGTNWAHNALKIINGRPGCLSKYVQMMIQTLRFGGTRTKICLSHMAASQA